MRVRGTWIFLFFTTSALVVAATLHHAFRDLFAWLQIDNHAVLGDAVRLSTLLGVGIALVLAVFFGLFYQSSRRYVDQCISEFTKVAYPEWKETKLATFTVVLVSVVASLILGVFDSVFAWLTTNNLFIW